ncbi:MAG: glycerol-3-phosphate dehydrogenase/oxidase [Desulfobacteraceae bacterium]|nr:glycerol-3-phosphate dehydrogenase/oxidase [Desulfobacteraceae bacterium]
MVRDINALVNKEFDLIVIGGGIFGVCAAWDAVLRGLSVVVLEKGDFSGATSANHFKMVHGGIRYLQHGDIVRVRESSRERSALLRIAPHLVKPLPIVIPTYGQGMKGKAILGAGILLYDMLTIDRNKGLHNDRRIPRGSFISRKSVLRLFPGIRKENLTGAAVFYDGQMHNPPRVVLSFLRAAVEKGAAAANYTEVTGFLKEGERVFGVQVRDRISNRTVEIRGQCILNASGPWAHRLLESGLGIRLRNRPAFSRDLALVVNRRSAHGYAIALPTPSKDTDALLDRGGRHLFAVPWRGYTLIGVWHKLFTGHPDEIDVEPGELENYVTEINKSDSGLQIRVDEINLINTGLTLFGEEGRQDKDKMSFGKRSMLIDHESMNGVGRLVTLIGVRATTARGMASKAVDLVMRKLGKPMRSADTENIPIYGGDIVTWGHEMEALRSQYPDSISTAQQSSLVHNYGSRWPEVIKYAQIKPSSSPGTGAGEILKSEIRHAVREEMALHLSDVVFRRTDLGTGRLPAKRELEACAAAMAEELGWDREKTDSEIKSIATAFYSAGPSNQAN